MIEINGEVYDGVMLKPDLDDALAHYGVMGMKWGIRKDLKKTGSISKKTKGKINKAVNKASYRKTRRMLNELEQLKTDYTGEREHSRRNLDNKGISKNNRNIKQISDISNKVKSTANKKGYSYNTRKIMRVTRRQGRNSALSYAIAGIPGLLGQAGYASYKADKHRDRYGTNADPYFVSGSTKYYKKKKKKA